MRGRNFGFMRKHETVLPKKTLVENNVDRSVALDDYVPIYAVPKADPADIP
jgi:hypothetical protein